MRMSRGPCRMKRIVLPAAPKRNAEGVKQLLALIVLLGTTIPATSAPGSVADMWSGLGADQPHPAVVRVVVSEGQTMSLGSGTLVAARGRHGLIITNWHVVRDARGPINVIFPDGFRSGASVLATDADWDLAALAIWRPNVEPVRLSPRPPQLDEELSIAGYGSGKYRSASGRCVQYISPGGNHPFEMLELSASARDGDSGGPIFNTQGELAGVLFGAARGRTAGSYCGRVQWFLNSVSARFDSLSTPPADTMIAQDLPAPAMTFDPVRPSINEVAVAQPRPPVDYSWEPSAPETPEPVREPSRRRALPLVSIPAPSAETQTEELPEPVGEFQPEFSVADNEAMFRNIASTPAGELATSGAPGQPGEVPVEWSDLAGATRPEHVRNLLAALGLVAIVFHALRVLSGLQGRPAPKRRRQPARRQQPARRRVVRRVRSW